jgi:hypothetical protein
MSREFSRRTFLVGASTLATAAMAASLPAVTASVPVGQMNAEPLILADLTPEELQFIMIFRRMDERQKTMVEDMLDAMEANHG